MVLKIAMLYCSMGGASENKGERGKERIRKGEQEKDLGKTGNKKRKMKGER